MVQPKFTLEIGATQGVGRMCHAQLVTFGLVPLAFSTLLGAGGFTIGSSLTNLSRIFGATQESRYRLIRRMAASIWKVVLSGCPSLLVDGIFLQVHLNEKAIGELWSGKNGSGTLRIIEFAKNDTGL